MDEVFLDATILNGLNSTYIADLYEKWLENPKNVDANWNDWFSDMQNTGSSNDIPSWAKGKAFEEKLENLEHKNSSLSSEEIRKASIDSLRAVMMIRAYRARGHLEAKTDPLNLEKKEEHPELNPEFYGFTKNDYDRPIFIDNVLGIETASLRQILSTLKDTYCGSIGVEYLHIQDPEQKSWIQQRIENIRNQTDFTDKGKEAIYERLVDAESFERFLNKKYTGTKRFGLDGSESVIPAIEQIAKRGSQLGLEEIVIGMAHRGRLNVLNNILQKPFRAIISEFMGNPSNPEETGGSGDVKYHMGSSSDREFDGVNVHFTLNANPSHLEVVNPVVIGRVRAKQNQRNDKLRNKVLGLLIHGDAAFAGQGILAETFDFAELRSYKTGGTLHLIINNQIGFTTSPAYSRSSPYCTDVAKIVMAPIFHVNADDPESVVHVSRIATEFRQKFAADAVIDIIGYRRYGHNEGDEPSFTQPIMYRKIADHPFVTKIYADKLIKEKKITEEQAKKVYDNRNQFLEEEFQAGSNYLPNKADWLEGKWTGLKKAPGLEERRGITGVTIDKIKKIGEILTSVPRDFEIHKKLQRVLDNRKKALKDGTNIDWSTAEQLAFGTLLLEGNPVRLSGQDCGRGTFSQRHAVFIDQNTEERYIPLSNINENQGSFEVIDSPLSEAGVLGFEYGFSQAEPNALVMWEAQFGDFANGAQVIVDQFISSGEAKWLRMSGLVMLLPHGYEGQGPEHSSARLERYLRLCAEDNLQVVNCSTPANYFHVLRRQLCREFRKPLIIMTPKSLLRNKLCVSNLDDMLEEKSFHRVMDDKNKSINDKDVKRLVICSGKVFYDLFEAREKNKLFNIKILRLEQIYPFPIKSLQEFISKTPQAEIIWCQEEPENMGSWSFIDRRLEKVLIDCNCKYKRPVYVGRPEAASPATGTMSRHLKEQKKLVNQALGLEKINTASAAE